MFDSYDLYLFIEYLYIYNYFILCLVVSFLLSILSILMVYQKPGLEKLSSYECGFNPFNDARSKFEIRFYLVGILFIIFDLEIIYLYPWILCIHQSYVYGHVIMFTFLYILTIGFIYEWVIGALDWD